MEAAGDHLFLWREANAIEHLNPAVKRNLHLLPGLMDTLLKSANILRKGLLVFLFVLQNALTQDVSNLLLRLVKVELQGLERNAPRPPNNEVP